ncbi:prepilin-type N-terminal cleavage/methylation domain-containing protein [Moraxella nasovis]|uniref:prepilin-type N-terminal cleavage/methylation domain-containing protein n=1 Tax=Moraxella nasovis TaxID=2904121 RepID=UPI001F6130FB|nr:prepilin-type N-terminal cleavage/methylation domain-containing protein [Moraxella nasovis]UNU73742.1 prepilin-type N-terminal cleavage/methylation domain-containing protein [Moraxella nasovis]
MRERGFSLLELMVVLLISSVLLLALMQVYTLGIKSTTTQKTTAELMATKTFALSDMVKNIRLAGLDVGDDILSGGAAGVLTDVNQLAKQHLQGGQALSSLLTRMDQEGTSHTTDRRSDQLTIIYRAAQDMYDCEGALVLGPRQVRLSSGKQAMIAGQVVIERYFIGESVSSGSPTNQDSSSKSLSLRCDAGKFVPEAIKRDGTRNGKSSMYNHAIIDAQSPKAKKVNTIYQFGDNGVVIADDVVGFWVQMSIQTTDGVRWLSPKQYHDDYAKTHQHKPIVLLKVALLNRSSVAMPTDDVMPAAFDIFGKRTQIQENYLNYRLKLHQVDIALRNVANEGVLP